MLVVHVHARVREPDVAAFLRARFSVVFPTEIERWKS